MDTFRPHDLLFVGAPGGFEADEIRPDWLDAAWAERAPLVVRRASSDPGRVPVGARGRTRAERCAGQVMAASVIRHVTPGMLARALPRAPQADGAPPACVAALLALAPRLHALDLDWGPVGGTGFWLASGLPVLRTDSDLDLLVRSPRPLAPGTLAALAALQAGAGCRVDVQVDTGIGGFALLEYARGGKVLLKTARGPLLVDDPWREGVSA